MHKPGHRQLVAVKTDRRHYTPPAIRPLDRSRWRRLVAVHALVDLFALSAALVLATGTRFGRGTVKTNTAYGRGLWMWLLVWWGAMVLSGLYERHKTDNVVEEIRNTVNGVTLGAVAAIAGAFFVHFNVSRLWVTIAWGLGLAFVIAGRLVMRVVVRKLRTKGHLRRRAVVVGTDAAGSQLATAAERARWEGVDIVGFVGDGGDDVLGQLKDLREIVVGTQATEVLVASTVAGNGQLAEIVGQLDGLPVELRVAPGLDGFLPSRLKVHPLGDRALVSVERVELRAASRVVKRVFDLALGIPLLIVALPVIAALGVAIRIDSRGPVFFRQTRVGRGGKEFKVWKLRSMVVDAEEKLRELKKTNEADGLLFKMKRDPRVTRVGAFIRKVSLDELPQLFNVVAGQMSLVGPRPPLPEEVANYDSSLVRRLLVKPGMTGLWQVSGRHELTFDEYVWYDMLYVQNWSIALDLFIIAKTIPAMFSGEGSY